MKTKIIATVGPSTVDFNVFKALVDEGVSYLRINTSYGDIKQYNLIMDNLKRSEAKDVQVMFDIKNLQIIPYIQKNNIKVIAHSFTESPSQLLEIRKLVPEAFIISKIETLVGVQNFDEILTTSDGVMIARGDLGEAASLERVPCLQKRFTKVGLKKGKFMIAATEMLLSMTENSSPTRAEVSDVANAVFDGVDAVMLSEETAIGRHPIEAVSFMKKIIQDAEKCT